MHIKTTKVKWKTTWKSCTINSSEYKKKKKKITNNKFHDLNAQITIRRLLENRKIEKKNQKLFLWNIVWRIIKTLTIILLDKFESNTHTHRHTNTHPTAQHNKLSQAAMQ